MDKKQLQSMKPQTASQEILSKKELIKQILTDYPETRDSDRRLCVMIWEQETHFDPLFFFDDYQDGTLTSADSISRLKRLIQREHPELRGINKDSEEEKCREIFTGELNFPNNP